MLIAQLNHINIRTANMTASARYYQNLFGFNAVPVPGLMAADQALWLVNAHGDPIIHLFSHPDHPVSSLWPIPLFKDAAGEAINGGTGSIHHVALTCSGLQDVLNRLESMGAAFSVHEAKAQNMTQVFTRDPHGILLELNLSNERGGVDDE